MLAVVGLLLLWPLASLLALAGGRTAAQQTAGLVAPAMLPLAANTLLVVLAAVALALPLGTALAVTLVRTDLPIRRLLTVLVVVPALVPGELHATAWLAAVGQQGVLARWAGGWHLSGLAAAAWIHAMIALPWVVAVVAVAVLAVEPQLEWYGLQVAGAAKTLWHVTLRRSVAGVVAAGVVAAVLTAGEMAVTDLLQVRTYAEAFYVEFVLTGRMVWAARVAVPGMVLLTGLLALAAWYVKKLLPGGLEQLARARPVFRLGRRRLAAALCVLAVVTLEAGVPVLSLVWRTGEVYPGGGPWRRTGRPAASAAAAASRPPAGLPGQRPNGSGPSRPGWSALELARNLAGSVRAAGPELGYSLLLAAAAAGWTVPLALLLAWWARRSRLGRFCTLAVVVLLFALPAPVVGAGVLTALNNVASLGPAGGGLAAWAAAVLDSPLALIWAQGLRALPFVLLVIGPAVALVPKSTLDWARLAGAGHYRQLWHVVIPAARAAIVVAALLAAVVALGELGASVLVAPPGLQPLSIRIFTLAHTGVESYLSGLCLVLLATIGCGAAAILLALRWMMSRGRLAGGRRGP